MAISMMDTDYERFWAISHEMSEADNKRLLAREGGSPDLYDRWDGETNALRNMTAVAQRFDREYVMGIATREHHALYGGKFHEHPYMEGYRTGLLKTLAVCSDKWHIWQTN